MDLYLDGFKIWVENVLIRKESQIIMTNCIWIPGKSNRDFVIFRVLNVNVEVDEFRRIDF